MTTPNIEELIAKLSYYSGDGVQIDMARQAQRQAADALQSQAERIKKLERTPQVGYFYKWKEAMHGVARLMDERDALRAQLAEIAATDPVLVVEKEPDYWSGGHFHEGSKSHIKSTKVWRLPVGTQLFTRPMPAQDATELVKDAERYRHAKLYNLLNGWNDENLDRDVAIHKALSKYKGAKL